MSEFTLGKLFVNEGQPIISVMCGDRNDPEIVAMLETNDPMMVANRNDGVDYDLLETYANLFAAAPDLLAALEKTLDPIKDAIGYYESIMEEADVRATALGRLDTFRKIRNEVYAAIAKAKGEVGNK